MTVTHGDLTIDWLGYATVRLESPEAVVYVDPGRYGVLTGEWTPPSDDAAAAHPPTRDYAPGDGDLVLVTHLHHYDPEGIDRVASDDATIVTFEGINVHETGRTDLRPLDLPYDVRRVGMEDELLAAGLPIWTVPAYNHPDGPRVDEDGTPIHPEGKGCGYLVAIGGERVFVAGDTDVLEGHDQLDATVFLPSISGSFTWDRREAAELAEAMDPDLVVPIHYNTFPDLEADSAAFAADLEERGVPVELDEA